MYFKTYLNQAWSDHATQSAKVADEFSVGTELIETNEHIAQMVGLVTHVMGEHLGRWKDGIAVLKELTSHSVFIVGSETEKSVLRSVAVLELAAGNTVNLDSFSLSDQIRITATAASAFSERDTVSARNFLQKAIALAESGLDKKDPANRALAITGNNLACALGAKKSRIELETELMILAAQAARKYWEIAGTWYEVGLAEYRLTMTFIQASDASLALRHAQNNIEILRENSAGDSDMFYGFQALALAEKKRENTIGFKTAVDQAKLYFEKLNNDDRSYCEAGMKMLE